MVYEALFDSQAKKTPNMYVHNHRTKIVPTHRAKEENRERGEGREDTKTKKRQSAAQDQPNTRKWMKLQTLFSYYSMFQNQNPFAYLDKLLAEGKAPDFIFKANE